VILPLVDRGVAAFVWFAVDLGFTVTILEKAGRGEKNIAGYADFGLLR